MKQLRLTKVWFKKICDRVHFDFNEDLYQDLKQEWKFLIDSLNALKAINVDNVEPFTRISPPIEFSCLRNDQIDPSYYLNKVQMLKNAPTSHQNYVTIKRIL